MSWFPNKPPLGSSANDFPFMRWFQQLYRFVRGENRANLTLSTTTNLSEDFMYPADATSAGFTVTLPLAANYQYKKFCIKKVDSTANVVTVGVSGSDTIDGASTTTLTTQWDSVMLFSDGVNKWYKINSTSAGGGTVSVDFSGVIWLTMVGGGGGGGTSVDATHSGGGGGAGEAVESLMLKVTPSTGYSYSVGGGGATDTNGTDSTFDIYACLGGKKGTTSGGNGGGTLGGAGGSVGATGGTGLSGAMETTTYFGGGGGGGGGSISTSVGGVGAGSGGYFTGGAGGANASSKAGGGGGAATIYGKGAAGGAGGSVGVSATSTWYGSGGGGGGGDASTKAGGSGAGGYILIAWIGGAQVYTSGSGTWTAPS